MDQNIFDVVEKELEEMPKFPSEEELEYPEKAEENLSMQQGEDDFQLEQEYFDPDKQEEQLWKARTGLNRETLCGAIETIIFMSERPVSIQKIKKLIDDEMPIRVIHESILKLQEGYEQTHHGLRLQEVAEGYQFRTKATFSKYVQDLFKVNSLVLSPTALEVLAIIAYKQPVSKNEVEKIRGVDSSHIIRGLMDKRLVKVTGRSNEAGRPSVYGTTPEFLEVFNLADLSGLPPEHELDEMITQGVGNISDIKTIVHSSSNNEFDFDEIDELDQLSDSIKSISVETSFTKSLKVEEKKRINESGEKVKTAFDLLEDHLNEELVKAANIAASESSELSGVIGFPEVISDLTAGPFNIPEIEEEFQMIDLETGDVIEEDALDLEVELEEESEAVTGEEVPFFAEDDAKKLSSALDDVFSKISNGMTSEELSEDQEKQITDQQDLADKKSSDIDELTDSIVNKGSDFDLDLSFLK